jgi:uncharacterized membrane protein YedE/YeeE
MVYFDYYWRPFVGGTLIALATTANLYLKGRITGFSGIFYGVITGADFIWKISFLLGIWWISSLFYAFVDKSFWDRHESFEGDLSIPGFLVSGFLVGLGTKLANGCTSGHGVCGLPRFSIRSWVAVGCFLSFAIGACILRSNVPFLDSPNLVVESTDASSDLLYYIIFGVVSASIIILIIFFYCKKDHNEITDIFVSFLVGAVMGLGLILSGMNRRSKVKGFLDMSSSNWDPTLLIVLGMSVGINLVTFNLILNNDVKPIFAEKMEVPTNKTIDFQLVAGSILFGIGWGWSGICPGPAMVCFFVYMPHIIFFLICVAIGQLSAALINRVIESYKDKQKNLVNEVSK